MESGLFSSVTKNRFGRLAFKIFTKNYFGSVFNSRGYRTWEQETQTRNDCTFSLTEVEGCVWIWRKRWFAKPTVVSRNGRCQVSGKILHKSNKSFAAEQEIYPHILSSAAAEIGKCYREIRHGNSHVLQFISLPVVRTDSFKSSLLTMSGMLPLFILYPYSTSFESIRWLCEQQIHSDMSDMLKCFWVATGLFFFIIFFLPASFYEASPGILQHWHTWPLKKKILINPLLKPCPLSLKSSEPFSHWS